MAKIKDDIPLEKRAAELVGRADMAGRWYQTNRSKI